MHDHDRGGANNLKIDPLSLRGRGQGWGHLKIRIIRAFAALRRDPADYIIGVGDITGLAVYAIRGSQLKFLFAGAGWVINHFIHIGGTKMLAGIAVFNGAAIVADIIISNHQMRWLFFFVLGAGFVNIGKFVE